MKYINTLTEQVVELQDAQAEETFLAEIADPENWKKVEESGD